MTSAYVGRLLLLLLSLLLLYSGRGVVHVDLLLGPRSLFLLLLFWLLLLSFPALTLQQLLLPLS